MLWSAIANFVTLCGAHLIFSAPMCSMRLSVLLVGAADDGVGGEAQPRGRGEGGTARTGTKQVQSGIAEMIASVHRAHVNETSFNVAALLQVHDTAEITRIRTFLSSIPPPFFRVVHLLLSDIIVPSTKCRVYKNAFLWHVLQHEQYRISASRGHCSRFSFSVGKHLSAFP